MTAEIDGDFVIFLIGFRINKIWKIWKWLPVFLTIPRMLRELWANPDLGFLHAQGHFGLRSAMVVQYWRSFEHLEAYAKAVDRKQFPPGKLSQGARRTMPMPVYGTRHILCALGIMRASIKI